MTYAEALAAIRLYTKASSAPTLSGEEINELGERAKRADSSDRAPDDPDWEETYNIPYAVARGWELKAAAAAGDYDFQNGNQGRFQRSQVYEMCMRQARIWKARSAESFRLTPPAAALSLTTDLPFGCANASAEDCCRC